jgi:hypothetical protein
VTFTYAANPLDTEVFLDALLQGHATMVDLNGAPAWAYTFTNRPSSGSFHVELHDVLGSNDVWSQNDKITLKPIPKIYFPAVLVNAPLNDASFPAGTQNGIARDQSAHSKKAASRYSTRSAAACRRAVDLDGAGHLQFRLERFSLSPANSAAGELSRALLRRQRRLHAVGKLHSAVEEVIRRRREILRRGTAI